MSTPPVGASALGHLQHGSRRRFPLVIAAYLMFVTVMASNAPSPLYVVYQQRFAFSSFALTGVFSCYAGGVAVALVAVGRVSDRIGRRPTMAPALLLLATSAALFMAARSTDWLYAARTVQGLGTGALTGAATAALVELEPNCDQHRASYLSTIAFIMGAATGPPLFGAMVQYLPWPTLLPFIVQIALIAIGLIGLALLPETVARDPHFRWQLQRPVVARPLLGPFVVAGLALSVSWGEGALFAALSPSIDRDLLHVDNHAVAGLVLCVFFATGGVFQIGLRHWPPRRSMTVGVGAVAVGTALFYVGIANQSLWLFLIGTVLAGAGAGISFMGSLSLINTVAPPARRAETVSAWNLVGYFALAAPVVGVGFLTGVVGLQDATGIFTAVIIVLCAVTALALSRTPGHPWHGARPDQLVELGLDPAALASGTG